jgi:hypothetical protein
MCIKARVIRTCFVCYMKHETRPSTYSPNTVFLRRAGFIPEEQGTSLYMYKPYRLRQLGTFKQCVFVQLHVLVSLRRLGYYSLLAMEQTKIHVHSDSDISYRIMNDENSFLFEDYL